MEFVTLNNGIKMPMLGYGVYQVTNDACERCVRDALSVGYRSIDTAQAYGNEEAVGRAIKNSGVPRDQIFLTTKVWVSNHARLGLPVGGPACGSIRRVCLCKAWPA